MNDLLSGHVSAMLTDLGQVVPHVRAGTLRAIAVTREARTALLPDVPTFAEAGLQGFASKSWFGLLVRAGTPPDVVARLPTVFVNALQEVDVRRRLAQVGLDSIGSTAEEFAAFMVAEATKLGKIVKAAGIKLD